MNKTRGRKSRDIVPLRKNGLGHIIVIRFLRIIYFNVLLYVFVKTLLRNSILMKLAFKITKTFL
jgi:hypothetical protein